MINIINELTPRSRVPLEELIVTQLVIKLPTFYGTLMSIFVFTRTHNSEALRNIS